MTDRDKLIEQGEADADGHEGACDRYASIHYRCSCRVSLSGIIDDLVDAGWRPPPSGDVIEQWEQEEDR